MYEVRAKVLAQDTERRFSRLRDMATARRLRMTTQREVLLRVLSRTDYHPTADQLYQRVRRVLPSVSPATVHRNVQDFVRAGLLTPFERPGTAVRYETNPDEHHHFVCRSCGCVWDVYLTAVRYAVDRRRSALPRVRVEQCAVQLSGLCHLCAARSARTRD